MVGRNQIELDERLRAVLDRLRVYSLFPGKIIDGKGIRNDPSKVQAIVDFPSHVMSQNCEASLAW